MQQEQEMQELEIRELVAAVEFHLAQVGYQRCTIDRLDAVWKEMIVYCDSQNESVLTAELGREFVWQRYGSILGDKDASHNVNRAVHVLLDYQEFGMVFKQSSATIKGFSTEYKSLFEGFLDSLRRTGTAEGSITTWRGRLFRFEYFLKNNRIVDFSKIEKEHVYTYVESLTGFSSGTIGATIRILRRLFDYAIQEGYHEENLVDTLPDVRRNKRNRLPTVFTDEEVERVLSVVDRNNALGKRNYAILMLVAKLGLRISDVRGMQFENIDWQNKTISIIQKKTGVPLDLPLLEDIGWAIIDYLQHGRPQTECPLIFVRHIAPYDGFTGSLRSIVLKYLQRAGIKAPADKPIGMHSFRHSLASTMLRNGAKYTDIAQTLGHASPESTQTYLSLDEEQLRQCALEVIF